MAGLNLNGILPTRSLRDILEDEKREAELRQQQPGIQSLASHVKKVWEAARTAKQQTVEQRLLTNLRQRRGVYEPDLLAEIKKTGGSEIYMMLTSNKCRAASAWLRDTLTGSRDEKPWMIDPTPLPDLPPNLHRAVYDAANQKAMQVEAMIGAPLTEQMARELIEQVKSTMMVEIKEMAKEAAGRMEMKMEDQLEEGGFSRAFAEFIDDIVTFPAACIKGPTLRRKPRMVWKETVVGEYEPVVVDEIVPTWSRVDPFNLYPAPNSTHPDDGDLIERHRLTRTSLSELIGVEGYDEGAIKAVLDDYGRGGLRDWLAVDSSKAQAEGKSVSAVMNNPEAEIDAIQYWGAVQGKMLIEWGMTEDRGEPLDPSKEYHCEVWLIGRWVIKAILNYDPFHRKPYFKACFEEIPGAWWGNAPPDLMRDCANMCNYAARAMANNMGIASGPQVGVNIDRLPPGEDLTQMFPWKIWQFTNDPMGSAAKPMEFFQPQSMSGELMAIFDKFSMRADEDTGIPRYITGDNAGIGGAGRTASGMSMLMSNAGKTIKQVIFNIDTYVTKPLIERLYFYNMQYADDPDLKGDVNIVARGANSLVVKDAAQVRRNEFLQVVLSSPVVQQIVGMEGIAALLHEQAKTLDMDADAIVPSSEALQLKQLEAQMQQGIAPPPVESGPPGTGARQAADPQQNKQQLMTGEPVTDNMGAPGKAEGFAEGGEVGEPRSGVALQGRDARPANTNIPATQDTAFRAIGQGGMDDFLHSGIARNNPAGPFAGSDLYASANSPLARYVDGRAAGSHVLEFQPSEGATTTRNHSMNHVREPNLPDRYFGRVRVHEQTAPGQYRVAYDNFNPISRGLRSLGAGYLAPAAIMGIPEAAGKGLLRMAGGGQRPNVEDFARDFGSSVSLGVIPDAGPVPEYRYGDNPEFTPRGAPPNKRTQ